MRPKIAIMHNLARSGGTLVSKCIGCMDQVALLSEVTPLVVDPEFNPIHQAINYHNLLTEADKKELQQQKSINWKDAINFVATRYQQKGMHLVLRDWAHLDFIGLPWIKQPAQKSAIIEALQSDFEFNRIALVRHPLDQFRSMQKLAVMQGALDFESFIKGYRAYAEMAKRTGFIKYEDFTKRPAKFAKRICNALDLPYDGNFLEQWHTYTSITGDVDATSEGRATRDKTIKPLKRHAVPPSELKTLLQNDDFRMSLELLKYEA